ncbi:aminotransferase [Acuticoccus sediminis]|uniref:Aminotransferase n=1 Tax=Acuticoccus sediminis TaxID=2184697 RepID=A0A8B2NQN6_9HYPH|nr:SIS domain-containing protein [Acuticoccus sediminis]RAH97309.1 aminotransferase [Acuticoccus sediminis]
MLAEAGQAAGAVATMLPRAEGALADLARRVAARPPPVITTAARGSSDHAASVFKYLVELGAGIPVASIGPSIASVYARPLRLSDALHVTVSQSGQSPDLVALQDAAKAGGALTLAVVNTPGSPVAAGADIVVDICAGPERSIAATKTFIASAAALAAVAAAIAADASLEAALAALPEALDGSQALPDPALVAALASTTSLFCVGRGPALGLAAEAALKFKELAALHAEAFSLAEVMHGPLGLVRPGFPVLGFVPEDDALSLGRAALERLAEAGANLATFSPALLPGRTLPMPRTGAAAIDALAAMPAFYRLVHAVALARGRDPEAPPHLAKVTHTA